MDLTLTISRMLSALMLLFICMAHSLAESFPFNQKYHLPVKGRQSKQVHFESLQTLKTLYISYPTNKTSLISGTNIQQSRQSVLRSFIDLVKGNDKLQLVECDANDNCIESMDGNAIEEYLKYQIKRMAMDLSRSPIQPTAYDLIFGHPQRNIASSEIQNIILAEIQKYKKITMNMKAATQIAERLNILEPHPIRFLFFDDEYYYLIQNKNLRSLLLYELLHDLIDTQQRNHKKRAKSFEDKRSSKWVKNDENEHKESADDHISQSGNQYADVFDLYSHDKEDTQPMGDFPVEEKDDDGEVKLFRFNELYHLPVKGRLSRHFYFQTLEKLKNLYSSHRKEDPAIICQKKRMRIPDQIIELLFDLVNDDDNLKFVECDKNDLCFESTDSIAIYKYLKNQFKYMALNLSLKTVERSDYDLIFGSHQRINRNSEIQKVMYSEMLKFRETDRTYKAAFEIEENLISRKPHPIRFLYCVGGHYHEIKNKIMCSVLLKKRFEDMNYESKLAIKDENEHKRESAEHNISQFSNPLEGFFCQSSHDGGEFNDFDLNQPIGDFSVEEEDDEDFAEKGSSKCFNNDKNELKMESAEDHRSQLGNPYEGVFDLSSHDKEDTQPIGDFPVEEKDDGEVKLFRFNELYHLPVKGRLSHHFYFQSLEKLKNLYSSHTKEDPAIICQKKRMRIPDQTIELLFDLVNNYDNLKFVECDKNDLCFESTDAIVIYKYLKNQFKYMALNLSLKTVERSDYDLIFGSHQRINRKSEIQKVMYFEMLKFRENNRTNAAAVEIEENFISRKPHPIRFLYCVGGHYHEIQNKEMRCVLLINRFEDMYSTGSLGVNGRKRSFLGTM